MARKRIRNVESNNDSNDGAERQESQMGTCPHVGKGIDIGSVKKAWRKKDDVNCQQCRKRHVVSKKNSEQDLWICMKCGNIGCGSTRQNHGQEHYETPRSDCHTVVVQMDSWTVRCLQCKSDINLEVNVKAFDAMKYLKRNFGSWKEKEEEVDEVAIPNAEEKVLIKPPVTAQDLKRSTPASPIKHNLLPVLGLENIGNTCYMNAVLQALAQTPGFVSQLEFLTQNNWQFTLKGGDNLISKEYGGYLPSLEGKLGEAGQLTKAVLKLTRRVKDGLLLRKSGVANENPGDVLRLMKKYSNTFYIGEQHDSHELLRLLLEGLRTEDLKRYQRGILNSLGICSPANEVTEKEREQFIAYKKQAMENELAVDKIFGGSLVSILRCIECGEITTTFENFMDISLPVESEKPKPFQSERYVNSEESKRYVNSEESKPSKHQLKKERKMARRGRKKNKGGRNVSEPNSLPVEISKHHSSSESASESEADVEDNLDSETNAGSTAAADSNRSQSDSDKTMESCGYTADESMLDTSASEKQELDKFYTNSEVIHPSTPEPVPLISGSSPEHSLALQSSEPCTTVYSYSPEPSIIEDFGSCEGGRGSPASSIEQADWGEESNSKSDISVLVKSMIKDLQIDDTCPPPAPFELSEEDNTKESSWDYSIKEVSSDSLLDSFCSKSEVGESLDRKEKTVDELTCNGDNKELKSDELRNQEMGRNESDVVSNKKASGDAAINNSVLMDLSDLDLDALDWGATITPQPEVEEAYSAYHCLNQFFSKETLNGGNKIGCIRCTKLKYGQEPKPNTKLLMANAHKQLLFLKLPKILTIHFKRFEVLRSRMCKITRKVSFPFVLDVAPYTSSRAKITENLAKYELYAVVEHSGHMTAGHYVAYIRVDPEEKSEKMFNIEEQKDNNTTEVQCEVKNSKNKILSGVGDIPSAKWYLISDTHVREVTSNEVSNAEAYLLFYKQLN